MEIIEADLSDPTHGRWVRELTQAYARDPMGNDGPLPDEVIERLVPALRAHPTTRVFLAMEAGRAIGIATTFLGFSTFAARPLLNVHDLSVLPEHRGRGVSHALLEAVERCATSLGCVKVTLEVLEGNEHARRIYESRGYQHAVYGAETGGAFFFAKPL